MTKQNKAMTLLSGITGIALETHAVMLEYFQLNIQNQLCSYSKVQRNN